MHAVTLAVVMLHRRHLGHAPQLDCSPCAALTHAFPLSAYTVGWRDVAIDSLQVCDGVYG